MANLLAYLGKYLQIGTPTIKRFSCTLSGNYANGGAIGTPGETLAFNSATNTGKKSRPKIPNGGSTGQLVPSTDIYVTECPNGYSAQVEQNAVSPTAANYALRIFAGGSGAAAPVELASGAYPAALTGAPLVIEVLVPTKYS